MGELGGILLFVLFAAIAVVKKKAEAEEQNPAPRPPQETAEEFKEEDTAPAVAYPHYESIRHSEGSFDASPAVRKRTLTSTTLRDDRKNDWMAKQLREERRIRNSTDLGAVHDDHCEAREIKTQHAAAHRAGRIEI